MSNKPSIIDSLKRLERAGDEFSRTTEKLRKSAEVVADKILEMTEPLCNGKTWGDAVGLPEGIEIHFIGVGETPVLTFDEYTAWKPLSSRVADGRNESEPASRKDVLRFAKMIADGYLDRLSTWLEKKQPMPKISTSLWRNFIPQPHLMPRVLSDCAQTGSAA